MGKAREQQIRATTAGMSVIAVLAVLVGIAIVIAVSGHLRSVIESSSISDSGTPVGVVQGR